MDIDAGPIGRDVQKQILPFLVLPPGDGGIVKIRLVDDSRRPGRCRADPKQNQGGGKKGQNLGLGLALLVSRSISDC